MSEIMNELKMRMLSEPEEWDGDEVVDDDPRLQISQCAVEVQESPELA
jgi:hypothetical protein